MCLSNRLGALGYPKLFVCLIGFLVGNRDVWGQVSEIQPRIVKPGETIRFTLTGKDLSNNLRVATSESSFGTKVIPGTNEQSAVEVSIPPDTPLGPFGIWAATSSAISDPFVVMVDDLPSTPRDANPTTLQTAQSIVPMTSISGTSRGAQSDFYRFAASQEQRISFEVFTQSVESAMDPLLRLLQSDGKVLATVDEDGVSAEARFSYQFPQAGEYVLEIRDSRYAAGGTYHLRIGDFPIIQSLSQLGVQKGETTTLRFGSADGGELEPRQIAPSHESLSPTLSVATKRHGGQASAWRPVHVSDGPVTIHGSDLPTLLLPFGIGGTLQTPGQPHSFRMRGQKNQTVRLESRTRSLRAPTLLRMQILDATGAKVAETPVTKEDEWSLDYKFPDDAEYTLQVSDLLGRGGSEYGYWIDAKLGNVFSLAFKGDANFPKRFVLEPQRGAWATDLLVKRFGFDGDIEVEIAGDPHGLQIINPKIPSGAAEHRLYVSAKDGWTPERLAPIRFIGRAKTAANSNNIALISAASSVTIDRLKRPYIPFPQRWSDGSIILAAVPAGNALYSVTSEQPITLAKEVPEQPVQLKLNRLAEDFKAAVTVLPQRLPLGWTSAWKSEGDTLNATLTRSNNASDFTKEFELLVYAEHGGRGIIESVKLPITWYDPIRVSMTLPESLTTGTTVPIVLSVQRTKCNAPVSIAWVNLPPGLSIPANLTIPADQTQVSFDLTLAKDIAASHLELSYTATSQFHGKDFSHSGKSASVRIQQMPQEIRVFPAKIVLDGQRAKRQLVVTGYTPSSEPTNPIQPSDWTAHAEIRCAHPEIAEVRGTVVYPKSDGQTQLLVRIGDVETHVPIQVVNSQQRSRTEFESEVLVALSKQGCNSGACHGSPSGKGMFRLSLRAFDRQLDELTLIREDFGRRINPVDPEQSLLLLKPLMRVSHGGGKQIGKDDAAYKVLADWIREGAQADPVNTARCVRLEVYPNEKRILPLTGGVQQLSVIAHFADGTQRDVTELVAYESSNQQIATIDASGRVTAKSKGEVVVLVRFLEHIESAKLTFIDTVADFPWQSPTPHNFVDELVYEKLRRMQYLPATTATDSEFMRRVYLDVIGLLPTVEESRAFLNDSRDDKRSRLIDSLLEREEYAKYWSLKWGDLLKLTNKLVGNDGLYKYHRWVEDAIRQDMPYDEFSRTLLTASGSTLANPPANFYRTATDMNECVETISQVFLGARLQCAKCHNHPFERWTQDNYYGLGAFFHRIQRKETLRPGEMFVWSSDAGEVTQPRTGAQMKPWLPVAGSIEPSAGDRRSQFAEWLTKEDNPYFAKIGANRIWSHLFSRGIIDPVDDFRESNPATNEPLLSALADEFRKQGYSTKKLLKTILNSRTYQSSFQSNESNRADALYFSHQQPRLLKAEQLLDALNHVTGVVQSFGSLPVGTKATQLPAPDLVKVDFLKVFGQPERSTVCACERSADSNLAMAIELFNGPLIHERLRDPNNRFRKALASGVPQDEVLNELYLAAFCRMPSDAERLAALDHIRKKEDPTLGFEDICWAMLNTDEFLFQH